MFGTSMTEEKHESGFLIRYRPNSDVCNMTSDEILDFVD